MNYLDYIYAIPKFQEGKKMAPSWGQTIRSMIPGYKISSAYSNLIDNPSAINFAKLGYALAHETSPVRAQLDMFNLGMDHAARQEAKRREAQQRPSSTVNNPAQWETASQLPGITYQHRLEQ